MKLRQSVPAVLFLTIGLVGGASAADAVVQFDGGIGVDPVAGINVTTSLPIRNDVLGVPPGGRPWVIRKLKASFYPDGTANVRGQGLLFSGGDAIGTRGSITQVRATLFCGGIAYDTPPMALDPNGNFSFRGQLSMFPPAPCIQPVLLVRSLAGNWFAAGIPGTED